MSTIMRLKLNKKIATKEVLASREWLKIDTDVGVQTERKTPFIGLFTKFPSPCHENQYISFFRLLLPSMD
jgi:hypothetical protein